jgi:hypothetical protein
MSGEGGLSEEEIQLCRKAFAQFDKDGEACSGFPQAAVVQRLNTTAYDSSSGHACSTMLLGHSA